MVHSKKSKNIEIDIDDIIRMGIRDALVVLEKVLKTNKKLSLQTKGDRDKLLLEFSVAMHSGFEVEAK